MWLVVMECRYSIQAVDYALLSQNLYFKIQVDLLMAHGQLKEHISV